MLPQKLVILWVTLAPGWDTRPDWGHKLVLDLLPGVLLKVSLDGTRLWNFPLQFCIEENKRAMNAGSKLEKVHPCFPSFLTTMKSRALFYSFPSSSTPRPQAPVLHPLQLSPPFRQSLLLAQVSAQGTGVLLCSPPAAIPVPPCYFYSQECKRGDWYQAAALEATLVVKANSAFF